MMSEVEAKNLVQRVMDILSISSANGCHISQLLLGLLYEKGCCGLSAVDLSTAYKYFESSFQGGSAVAYDQMNVVVGKFFII